MSSLTSDIVEEIVSAPTPSAGEKRESDTAVDETCFPTDKRPRLDEPTPSTSLAASIYSNPSTSKAVVEIPTTSQALLSTGLTLPPTRLLLNGVVPKKKNATKIMNQYLESGATAIRLVDFYRDVLSSNRRLTGNNRHDFARYEMAVIDKTEAALAANITFGASLCNEILSVSDDTFDLILSRHPDISVENINMITTYAWAKNTEGELLTDNKRKFIAIARYSMLPKLVNVGPSIRSLYLSYQKLVAIDQHLVMDHLLLPLLDTNGSIPKALYHGVNTHIFLIKILDRMSSSFRSLTDGNVIPTLTFLIDKEQGDFLDPPASETLFKVLEISLQTRSTDTKVASFYHLIIKKFAFAMDDAEVKQMHSLNYYNQTFLKEAVDKLVEDRLKGFKCTSYNLEPTKPNVFRAPDISNLLTDQSVVFRKPTDYVPYPRAPFPPTAQQGETMDIEIDQLLGTRTAFSTQHQRVESAQCAVIK